MHFQYLDTTWYAKDLLSTKCLKLACWVNGLNTSKAPKVGRAWTICGVQTVIS